MWIAARIKSSQCDLMLSKDSVAAPLAPVRCDKSAAQAATPGRRRILRIQFGVSSLGGENAACANKRSRNYRGRRDSVLSYRQVRSGLTAREFTEDTRGIGLPSCDLAAAIAGVRHKSLLGHLMRTRGFNAPSRAPQPIPLPS